MSDVPREAPHRSITEDIKERRRDHAARGVHHHDDFNREQATKASACAGFVPSEKDPFFCASCNGMRDEHRKTRGGQ